MAESAVRTAKHLLQKATAAGTDFQMAILDHQNTPSQGLDLSPMQWFMNRRARTLLPTTSTLLQPCITPQKVQQDKLVKNRNTQAKYYNRAAKDLRKLEKGDVVTMTDHTLLRQKMVANTGVIEFTRKSLKNYHSLWKNHHMTHHHLMGTTKKRVIQNPNQTNLRVHILCQPCHIGEHNVTESHLVTLRTMTPRNCLINTFNVNNHLHYVGY